MSFVQQKQVCECSFNLTIVFVLCRVAGVSVSVSHRLCIILTNGSAGTVKNVVKTRRLDDSNHVGHVLGNGGVGGSNLLLVCLVIAM